MKTRQAAPADLPRLNEMYRALARQMAGQGHAIWDDVYPCVCLPGDIQAGRLFVLEDGGAPKAAFALCRDDAAAAAMGWQAPAAPALYLARLGVAPACRRTGVGSQALQAAMALASGQARSICAFLLWKTMPLPLHFIERTAFPK